MNPRLLPAASVARSVLRTQSDSRLTELARAGSEPAFEAIVARYRCSLVRHCARVLGEADAEEAVQDALVKAHAALVGGDPVRRLAPWLHVLAYNAAVSSLRARASRPQPVSTGYESLAPTPSAGEYGHELREVLDAVRSLPDRQRDAIVMRELEGRSYEDIAARLGSSHGAVRQLLHRARSTVRARFGALLPLEPLARWALTGAGSAGAAGGATASSACAVGAKACATLLLPVAVALVAAAPVTAPATSPSPSRSQQSKPKSKPMATRATTSGTATRAAAAAPVATITYVERAGERLSPSPRTRDVSQHVFVVHRTAPSAHQPRRLSAEPRPGVTVKGSNTTAMPVAASSGSPLTAIGPSATSPVSDQQAAPPTSAPALAPAASMAPTQGASSLPTGGTHGDPSLWSAPRGAPAEAAIRSP